MRLLDKLLGKKNDYPTLEASSDAAQAIDKLSASITQLAEETGEQLEVVPGLPTAYVFVGKPPKKFGLAWVTNGEVGNFKSLVEDKGIQPLVLQTIVDKLTAVYERNANVSRFQTTVGERQIVVTPSDDLHQALHTIMDKVMQAGK
jgi:hypothetical protein